MPDRADAAHEDGPAALIPGPEGKDADAQVKPVRDHGQKEHESDQGEPEVREAQFHGQAPRRIPARPACGAGRVRSGPRLRMRQAKTMRAVNRIL